ncbi:DUF6083 domain-containing protein [Streptomyces sp. A012304]|uniref:DUF6083 domain-containing protein n=1 Tax=Streptomyces sp. A012304 TaxID=375446 RepID=UPI00222E8666|nr:DUF6083 domain-containing protein [Streptomyces sp. A012304]
MGAVDRGPRRLREGRTYACPYCGLPQDRVLTSEHDWVLLEPGVDVLAHLVPAEHRWIVLSDGRVTVYGVCPPVASQRCRIEHRLTCAAQPLPDLWPWLTAMRGENARRARRADGEPDPGPGRGPRRGPGGLPDVGFPDAG